MSGVDFQRARTPQQKEERRQSILAVVRQMMQEMPVASLSLNGLSRRVGLGKVNILRYFDSREAILLQVLIAELEDWIEELLEKRPRRGSPRETAVIWSKNFATTLREREIFCELTSVQASILERNISAETALSYKKASKELTDRVVLALKTDLRLEHYKAVYVVASVLLLIAGAWPYSRPADALQKIFAEHPDLAENNLDFIELMQEAVSMVLLGALE